MAEFKVTIPCDVEADYGIGFNSMLEVTGEFTPEDIAPRDRYLRPEYPDTPASVEIATVTMMVADARIPIPVGQEYFGGLDDAVIAAILSDALHAAIDAADAEAYNHG